MSKRSLQVALALIGVFNAATGALALIAPDTFFDQIGTYGVENSHYVGDVGAFVLAYGIALLIAIRVPSWRVPVLALGAIYYGLHALNHVFDTGEARSEARGWGDTIAIAFGGLLLAYLARVSARLGGESRSGG
ncbi:MAG: DUF4345 family protein [Actinomycetota bacterium]|nr:DUF4345 family protein [Actinomycetota bacterium]